MIDEIQGAPKAMTFPDYYPRKFLENFSAGFDAQGAFRYDRTSRIRVAPRPRFLNPGIIALTLHSLERLQRGRIRPGVNLVRAALR